MADTNAMRTADATRGFQKIAVVGAGQMGSGIAQVAAQSGLNVVLIDVDARSLERARTTIESSLDRMVEKGRIQRDDKDKCLARIARSSDLSLAGDVELVVEAVPENEELKRQVFSQLDLICPEGTILASNTSSIPITTLAGATRRPDRVVGIHFTNPVPVMRLVEIVSGYLTSDETTRAAEEFARKLGKETIRARDYPGFTATRLGIVLWNEAAWMLYEGQATREDIDKAAKLGLNLPMGVLELADFVGLDSILSILRECYETFGSQRYFPCPLLTQMVQAGQLGRKSGRGFYVYDQPGGASPSC